MNDFDALKTQSVPVFGLACRRWSGDEAGEEGECGGSSGRHGGI